MAKKVESAQAKPVPAPVAPGWVLGAGTVVLLLAYSSAALMAVQHVTGLEMPGCGRGSPCDEVAKSVWGTIPGLKAPTSFLGAAYFAGLMLLWSASRGTLGVAAKWLVRLGGVVSLVLVGVMLKEQMLCKYCLAVHTCNLLFLGVVEGLAPRTRRPSWWLLAAGAVACIATMAGLMVWESSVQRDAQAKAERELKESTAKMVQPPPVVPKVTPVPAPKVTPVTPPPPIPPPPADPRVASGFTGRYRFGPELAAARIVMFTDYQCPDCKKIEGELSALMQSGQSISVIIKHFPMWPDCNSKAPRLHANACWAARAAQAAGIIKGDAGFWEMHHWLFSQAGSFTDQNLPPQLQSMGYNIQQFLQTMQGSETEARVKADADEGNSLGIYFTPMIFINGVELKGWNAPQALTRAVQAVLAANPPPQQISADRPPTAVEKYLSDWREQVVRPMPQAITNRSVGPADAPVTVVIWGDYQEPGTQEADGILRLFADLPDAHFKYTFAHFPMDMACNKVTQVTRFPGSCLAAKAAEAADLMAGPQQFWNMHNWLMQSKGAVTAQTAGVEAGAEGIDVQQFTEALNHPVVDANITRDEQAAAALGIQSIPMIFINGKYVPRFKLDNENLLPRMIEEAYQAAKGK